MNDVGVKSIRTKPETKHQDVAQRMWLRRYTGPMPAYRSADLFAPVATHGDPTATRAANLKSKKQPLI